MIETVLRVAAQDPDRVAIASDAGRLSYGQLVEGAAVAHLAATALHRERPRAGKLRPPVPAPETSGTAITAVSLSSAFETARLLAQLSGFRGVTGAIDPRWPLEHRVTVIVTTGIGLVITDDAELGSALACRGWGGTVVTGERFAELEAEIETEIRASAEPPKPAVRDADEPFLLLFSSGTTSAPKGFLKTRRQYRVSMGVSGSALGPVAGVQTFAPGPISYSLTLYAVVECLAWGGSVHLADEFSPFELAGRARREGIERIVAVPAVAQATAHAAKRDPAAFASLRQIVVGGANLPASIRASVAEHLPGTELVSYYGAAEIGFIGLSRSGDDAELELFAGVEASVRDERGAEVAPGELGELWIRAATCSDGYLAGTTHETLRGPGGWATVHDQARFDDNGVLRLAGRAGDIVVTGGHKVALPEIDRAFDGMPGLGDALGESAFTAVALPHDRLGSVIAFVVETAPGANTLEPAAPDRAALISWATARLAPQFVPQRWLRLARLPRTVGGKIRRGEVTQALLDGEGERL